MTFDYPFILTAFTIFIPLVIFDIVSRKKRGNLPEEIEKKLRVSGFFFRLFLVLVIVALSGPRFGTGFAVSEYRRGLDMVFAVDISRSMDIRDAQTNGVLQSRLERGLLMAKESAASVFGARFAAAIGRGRGYLSIPLTFDNEAVMSFLESLDGTSLTGRSTNLESLIDAASGAFQNTSAARKVIVFVSDGESHSGNLRNAINRCIRDGVIVCAVAVGTDEGRPVPTDFNNQTPAAISRRDAGVMRMAAERTGGIYIDASREDSSSALSSFILSLAQKTSPGSTKKEQKQRRTLFIILAIIAYGASKFAPLLPSRLPFVSIIFAAIFFSSCSEGKLLLIEANYLNSRGRYDEAVVPYLEALNYKGAAPYAEYGLALTFYLIDDYTAALKRYGNSQRMLETFPDNEHRELRYRNHYNSGIIYFEQEDFHSAAQAFREALRTEPGKIEAKRNLELALMSISTETNSENNREQRSEQREILFEYVMQEEQKHWKSREWTPEENYSGSLDY